jgi:hypothetical protein
MRRFLSIILKVAGLALGLGVVALLIALEWPDAASAADKTRLGRHILDVFWLDLLIGLAIGFPFLWLGDKLSPDGLDTSANAATTE